ncbi:MAG: helix-turn-helix domain-containing protein [Ruminiclostridium sp.]|nr:helix-turn-helix domain-containing protein [Ruminiclostridium sp.]
MIIKKVTYKFRVFISFLLIIVIIIAIISSLLYANIRAVMQNEAMTTNLNIIIQLKNANETMLKEVGKSLNQIVFDNTIETFSERYPQITDYREKKDVFDRLSNVITLNTYFTSCFLYYINDDKVIDLNIYTPRMEELDSSKNKDFILAVEKKYQDGLQSSQKSPFFRIIQDGKTEVYTIVKAIRPTDLYPNALLIVTINPDYFKDNLNTIKIDREAQIYIMDEYGELVSKLDNDTGGFLNSQKPEENKKQFSQKAGSLIKNIDGQNYLVTFITSEMLGWKYIYTLPTVTIYAKMQFVQKYTIILAVLCLFFGIAISLLLTRNLYNPIGKLVSSLKKNSGTYELSEKDGLEYIGKNIDNLISKNKSIEKSLSESMPVLKNLLLSRLLKNDIIPEEKIWDKLKYYNTKLDERAQFCVFVISVDQYEEMTAEYTEKQISMLEIYYMKEINGICSRHFCYGVETVKMNKNELAVILGVDAELEAERSVFVNSIINEIHEEMIRNVKFTMTIGVGAIREDILHLGDSYKEALASLNYRAIKGNNQVILVDELPKYRDWSYIYPYDIEKDIFYYMKQGDGDKTLQALTLYFNYAQENSADIIEIRYAFLHLLESTIRTLGEISINIEQIPLNQSRLYSGLMAQKTVIDAFTWFQQLHMTVIKHLNERKDYKVEEIVAKIMEYIQKNYTSPELCLESISDTLHLSVSYIGKLFRDSTAKSIKEYITDKRLEMAKYLLANTGLKVKEIGERVGYNNDRSFINMFKKNYGETPGEYKDRKVRGII